MGRHVETIVVGGGQAGLSTSWYLMQVGREHLVLDRGKIGDTWRQRWDTFCLVTPNRFCKLPGFPYDGDDPEGFMPRDEIVEYVERFAATFDPPHKGGVSVRHVGSAVKDGRFILETTDGPYSADNLIIAVGTHQHANIPKWDANFSEHATRMHTRDYRNPKQLPEGGVLVVGSGQSGCQVVEDLIGAGRDVHLCVGNAGRIPRRYRGHDILEWDEITGYFDLVVDDHPKGQDIRFQPHPHLTGRDGGHTIDLRQFALDGVQLHGRLEEVDGTRVRFSGDVASTLDAIDEGCNQNMADIDKFISKSGMDAPPSDLAKVDWQPSEQATMLDLDEAGISTVIYATGFHPDFSWIDLPVFNERGYPLYQRGVTELPGLYFVGLHWMHTQGSGLFYGVGSDAEHVVNHLDQTHRR